MTSIENLKLSHPPVSFSKITVPVKYIINFVCHMKYCILSNRNHQFKKFKHCQPHFWLTDRQ